MKGYKDYCQQLAEIITDFKEMCKDMSTGEFERFCAERRAKAKEMGINPYIIEKILEYVEESRKVVEL